MQIGKEVKVWDKGEIPAPIEIEQEGEQDQDIFVWPLTWPEPEVETTEISEVPAAG